MPVTDFYDINSGKKEKSMISDLEQDSKKRISELEESLKKKKQVNFFDAPYLCHTLHTFSYRQVNRPPFLLDRMIKHSVFWEKLLVHFWIMPQMRTSHLMIESREDVSAAENDSFYLLMIESPKYGLWILPLAINLNVL